MKLVDFRVLNHKVPMPFIGQLKRRVENKPALMDASAAQLVESPAHEERVDGRHDIPTKAELLLSREKRKKNLMKVN
jgi:hypothetical protein